MLTNNTSEGNRIIAEFMGLYSAKRYYEGDKMQYHTSWEWLMPVVEKIETDFCNNFEVIIYSSSCHIRSITGAGLEFVGTGEKIKAVYDAILQFINWYNSQQNDPNGKV